MVHGGGGLSRYFVPEAEHGNENKVYLMNRNCKFCFRATAQHKAFLQVQRQTLRFALYTAKGSQPALQIRHFYVSIASKAFTKNEV
jgi:hypothetical protein